MATFTVTTLIDEADSGASTSSPGGSGLSLREAVELADGGDTITFVDSLAGGTIDLTLGQLGIEKPFPFTSSSLVIDGDLDNDQRPDITLDALGAARVIEIAPDLDTGAPDPNVAVTIDGLVITGGRASQDAGIQVRSSPFELRNSIVTGNVADNGGGGIGINNVFGGPIVTTNAIINSTISDNAAGDGAGIVFRRAELAIVNSVVSDNETTGGFAGGVRGFDARDLTIINSTVSGNSVTGTSNSSRVGGIWVDSGFASASITLLNATVTGNTAAGGGGTLTGGVRAFALPLVVHNSIVAGNAAAVVASDIGSPVTDSNGANIFGQTVVDGSVAGDLTGVAAEDLFADVSPVGTTAIFAGVLADNGGLTETVALEPTGLAVDGGGALTLLDPGPDREVGTADDTVIMDDQRGPGFARVVNLDGGGTDIGAFEVQSLPSLFTPNDDIVDLNAFDLGAFGNSTDALEGNDTVRLSETQNVGVRFLGGRGNDAIEGSASGDEIEGMAGSDEISGLAGADTLRGGNGDDTLIGGGGADILVGNAGRDLLIGGTGSDTLVGREGDDWLFGGANADLLFGGLGLELLNGGGGNDRFLFTNAAQSGLGAARDVIQGFDGVGNALGDVIDVSAIDAIFGGGNNAFDFIRTAAFSETGQLRVFNQGGSTIVAGNISGGAAAEFQIEVEDFGVPAGAWREADFVL